MIRQIAAGGGGSRRNGHLLEVKCTNVFEDEEIQETEIDDEWEKRNGMTEG